MYITNPDARGRLNSVYSGTPYQYRIEYKSNVNLVECETADYWAATLSKESFLCTLADFKSVAKR